MQKNDAGISSASFLLKKNLKIALKTLIYRPTALQNVKKCDNIESVAV